MKNEAVVRPLLLQQRVDDDDDHVCPMVCVCVRMEVPLPFVQRACVV